MGPDHSNGNEPVDSLTARMFEAADAFGTWSAPVLLMTADGRVRQTNAAGAALAAHFRKGLPPALSRALEKTAASSPEEMKPLHLEIPAAGITGQAEAPHLRIAVMPWGHAGTSLVVAQDADVQKRQEPSPQEVKTRYEHFLALMRDGFAWETDDTGCLVFISGETAAELPLAALRGTDPAKYAADPDRAKEIFRTGRSLRGVRLTLADAQGAEVHFDVHADPLYDANGIWTGARGMAHDVTAAQAQEEALQRIHSRERLLFDILRVTRTENGPQAILDTAAQGILPALEAEGAAIYRTKDNGFVQVAHAGTDTPEDLVSESLAQISELHPEIAVADNTTEVLTRATIQGAQLNGAVCLWHGGARRGWTADERTLTAELAAQIGNANMQMARETELRRLSETDPLTGLVNRRAFLAHLEKHLNNLQPVGALFYIDLDNFKAINDTCGHIVGDNLLRALADLLRSHTRPQDVAGRLGGDEFALLLVGMSEETAIERAKALIEAATETLGRETCNPDRRSSLSIGITLTQPGTGEIASALVNRADMAMYAAKKSGKGAWRLAATPDVKSA